MKKIFNSKIELIIDVIMYCIILVIGYIMLLFSDFSSSIHTSSYVYTSLYVLSFFFLIGYALTKKDNKYYYLLLSLLNIIFASFIMMKYNNAEFALYNMTFSVLVIIYTIFNFIVDILESKKLNKKKLYVKIPTTITLFGCGIAIAIVIYTKIFLSLYIMSYYFILFGLIKIIETMLYVIIDSPSIGNRILTNNVSTRSRKKTKIKEIKKKVPNKRKSK